MNAAGSVGVSPTVLRDKLAAFATSTGSQHVNNARHLGRDAVGM